MESTDLDQHGGVDSAREEAHKVPGESELLPGVQAPRECLSPRRQIGKVGAADRLLADGQGDQPDPNVTDGRDMATGDGRRDVSTGGVGRCGDGPLLTERKLLKPDGVTLIRQGGYTDGLAIDESETQSSLMTVQMPVDGVAGRSPPIQSRRRPIER